MAKRHRIIVRPIQFCEVPDCWNRALTGTVTRKPGEAVYCPAHDADRFADAA